MIDPTIPDRAEASESLKTLFAHSTDFVWAFDDHLRVMYANAPTLTVLGRTWDCVEGRSCRNLGLPEAASLSLEDDLQIVLNERKARRHETHLADTADSRRTLEWNLSPIASSEGAPTGVLAIGRPVGRRRKKTAFSEDGAWRGYRELVQTLPGAVYVCDRRGRIVLFNEAAVTLWGRSPVASRDKWSCFERILRADGTALPFEECPMAVTVKEGRACRTFEIEVERHDGTRRHILPYPSPLFDDAGHVAGAINLLVDVTEHRAAAMAAARLAAIVESSHDAIISKDLNGTIKTWNAGAAAIFGYTAAEAIGQSVTILIPEGRLDEEPDIIQRIRRGEVIDHYETIRRCKDGRLLDISLTVSPIRDESGVIIGASKIARDITRWKQAEAEVVQARDAAQAALQAKNDFIAALSHELRTPLNPVLLLASDGAQNENLSAELRADFETIRKNVELEARLIDDLLDLTRINRNKLVLDCRPVDAHAILRDALTVMQAEADHNGSRLVAAFGAARHRVFGDAGRLQQVFCNVLKNAVKFSPAGSCIKIETRVAAERNELEVAIADTGIGLTKNELAGLFQAFSQGEHAKNGGAHRFGGLGLGLAIAQLLAELHGGRIRATSPGRDHGAVFTIALPLIPAEVRDAGTLEKKIRTIAGTARSAEAPPRAVEPGNILLVEDHTPTRTALAHLLTRRRYHVVTARTAAEAKLIAGQIAFDLIISDIGLPDSDGYELMAGLRATQPYLSAIALTGYGMIEDIERSREAGFDEHLIKPIDIGQLERAVAALLSPS